MMRKMVIVILLAAISGLIITRYIDANCGDTWQQYSADTSTGGCFYALPGEVVNKTQTKHWRIFWTDGYERVDFQVQGKG